MKAPFTPVVRRRLLISHLAVLLFGLGLGGIFWRTNGVRLRAEHEAAAAGTLARAAALAFGFGTPEHARELLGKLPAAPLGADFDAASVMLAQTRLAVLAGEHLDGAKTKAHLERAAAACSELGKGPCELEQIRRLAQRLSELGPGHD